MSTTAATTSKVFLLPLVAGLPSLATLPPKVNAGADADPDATSLEETSALRSATFPAELSSATVDDLRSVAILDFVSRAGAAALAAPDPIPAELADDTAGCV